MGTLQGEYYVDSIYTLYIFNYKVYIYNIGAYIHFCTKMTSTYTVIHKIISKLSINYDVGCYAHDVVFLAYWSFNMFKFNSSVVKLSVIGCIILKHVPHWLI